ncbi:MAG: NBR1-Ig-like domain-containing protein [Chloroflexota bacterium]
MNQSIKRILFSIMAAIFLLTACAPSAPAATQDPALVQQLVEQSVALTVAAQSAEAAQAQAQAAAAATNTPLPTQTESVPPTPVLPTATPFVIVPPTVAPVTGGGGGGSVTVKPEYACNVIDQQPADNSTWKKKKDFDITWTLVNTGTKTWRKGLDIKYYSGPQMTTVTFVELPAMKPGDKYKVVLDAVTPDQSGFQVMTWSVEGNFCFPYVAINVE